MELSAQFPVKKLCRIMDVNRSGFYKWKKRLEHPSDHLKSLVDNIMLFKEYHARYPSHGYRWLNAKIRDNQRKAAAEQEAADYQAQYNGLTDQIEKIRADRRALLNGANLPLPGLSVEGGKLLYHGKAWDCMSGSEQLRVAAAIVRCLNPECGFVLLDKLEQMDMQTLAEFGRWLEAEGLQAIATRVSTGDECSIIIEDGWAQNVPASNPTPPPAPYQPAGFKPYQPKGV